MPSVSLGLNEIQQVFNAREKLRIGTEVFTGMFEKACSSNLLFIQ